MQKRISLTAVFEPVENGWTQATIAELPAVITVGPTLEDARELLLDALREYLLSLGDAVDLPEASEAARRESLEVLLDVG